MVNLVLMGWIDARPDAPERSGAGRVRGDRRADSRQLSGVRPRRVPHGHRRPCRRGRQGLPQERSGAGRHGVLRRAGAARRPVAADRNRSDVRADRTSSSGSSSAASTPTTRWSIASSAAKASPTVLTEQEILREIEARPRVRDHAARRVNRELLLRRGVWQGLAAYTIWGLFPIYWKLFDGSRRWKSSPTASSWSFLLLRLMLVSRRARRAAVCRLPRDHAKQVGLYGLAALLIALNWFLYVWARQPRLHRRDQSRLLHHAARERAARRRGPPRAAAQWQWVAMALAARAWRI